MGARVYPHLAPVDGGQHSRCCNCTLRMVEAVVFAFLGFLGISIYAGFMTWIILDTAPQYSAAITSVSGLDPATDLGRVTLDPEFNVTIRIAATSSVSGECLEVGTAVDVSYQGVRLAGAPVPRLCASPKHAAEARRVAWGNAVRVPRFVVDGLAEDMRNGVAAFDVTIALPPKWESRRELVQCMARRVGDDGALQAPCVVTEVDTAVNTSG